MAVLERTLALIKPDAVASADAILDEAKANGFVVLEQRRVHLTPEQASEFYSEHFGKTFFSSLVTFMSSGPLVAAILAKQNAVQDWRKLIGPTDANQAREEAPDSVRARYGTNQQRNAVHGSDSVASAQREAHFFFPNSVMDPLPSAQESRTYLSKHVNPTLIRGLTALCKAKPEHPIDWLADWLLENNPNKPSVAEPDH